MVAQKKTIDGSLEIFGLEPWNISSISAYLLRTMDITKSTKRIFEIFGDNKKTKKNQLNEDFNINFFSSFFDSRWSFRFLLFRHRFWSRLDRTSLGRCLDFFGSDLQRSIRSWIFGYYSIWGTSGGHRFEIRLLFF
jgi:hypothetical protein